MATASLIPDTLDGRLAVPHTVNPTADFESKRLEIFLRNQTDPRTKLEEFLRSQTDPKTDLENLAIQFGGKPSGEVPLFLANSTHTRKEFCYIGEEQSHVYIACFVPHPRHNQLTLVSPSKGKIDQKAWPSEELAHMAYHLSVAAEANQYLENNGINARISPDRLKSLVVADGIFYAVYGDSDAKSNSRYIVFGNSDGIKWEIRTDLYKLSGLLPFIIQTVKELGYQTVTSQNEINYQGRTLQIQKATELMPIYGINAPKQLEARATQPS